MLVFFLVVDGLLLYRYQLLQESQGNGSLATTLTTTSTEDRKALRVDVDADDHTWLQVIADGQTVFSWQRVGSEFARSFAADKQIVVETTNGGDVSAEANGKDVGRLGKSAEHVRWTFAL